MIKLTLQQIKETRNYVYYESPNFEVLFRSDMFAMKLWIPKSELRVEGDGLEGRYNEDGVFMPTTYPPFIEVGILDDSDKPADGPGVCAPLDCPDCGGNLTCINCADPFELIDTLKEG